MKPHRQFTLRTLCAIVAGVCVFSALAYYARVFVASVIQLNSQNNHIETVDLEFGMDKQVVQAMCKDAGWRKEIAGDLQAFQGNLQGGTEQDRVISALVLGEVAKPGSAAEDQLISALATATPRVTRAVIFALGSMGSEKAKAELLKLRNSTDRRIAEEAKLALEKLPKSSSDKTLQSRTDAVGVNPLVPAPNPPKP